MTPGVARSQSCSISVSVVPGAIALTLMFSGPYVIAADSVRLFTARFVAPYAGSAGLPANPPTLDVLTMLPLPAVAQNRVVGWVCEKHCSR